jgi:hypothetical protein
LPDFVNLDTTKARFFTASQETQAKITNVTNTTIYYKSTSDVSASSNDGSLTQGQSTTQTAGVYLLPLANAQVLIDYLVGDRVQDLTVVDDLTVSDTLAVTGATTLTGAATLTGGAAGGIPRNVSTWQPIAATSGTDTACSNGTAYVGSVFVPMNATVTGIQYLVGSVGGTDKVVASLHSSAGAVLANSATAGATVGTAAQVQQVALTATYAAKGPAFYFVALTFNGTTAKFRSVPAHTQNGVIGDGVTQTFGTVAAFTAPTTFVADKVPVASLY